MSTPINDGGPAFPTQSPLETRPDGSIFNRNEYESQWDKAGMSLRDWFAGRAMQTILSGAVLPTKEDREKWLPQLADISYDVADAMIAARNKKP